MNEKITIEVSDETRLVMLCSSYQGHHHPRKVHRHELAGIARALADSKTPGNVMGKIALSVACFDEAQDWPEQFRRTALCMYGLLPVPTR